MTVEQAASLAFLLPAATAYAAAIPFTGNLYMPQTTVTGAITFTVAASPVRGAATYLRLVANGTNVPAFTGFNEHIGSAGYDNGNGILNAIWFWYDGVEAWYSVAQEVGAVAVFGFLSSSGVASRRRPPGGA